MKDSLERHHERAAAIIDNVSYLTLATVTPDGNPWNSPVAGIHDSSLQFYWFSDKENQHSINVRANHKVFIAIYDSTAPEGSGEGVYVAADVEELDDREDILFARRIKKGQHHQEEPGAFLGDAVRRVYKAAPTHIWINDAEIQDGAFVRDYKVELSIDRIKEMIHETL